MKDTYYNDLTINTQIQSELDAFFEDFKGIVFAYAIMNKKDPSQMRIINNSPEWFTIYLEKNISSLTLLSFGLYAVWKIFSGKVMLSCQMVIT